MTFFLDLVQLPEFQGLRLAATGVRALERFSDITDCTAQPAALAECDRVDIIDDCLDLVTLRDDLPAGFEFTGLSLADCWLAIIAVVTDDIQYLDQWRDCLNSKPLQDLREAARERIGVRPEECNLRRHSFEIPDVLDKSDFVVLPEPIRELLAVAHPEWDPPRFSRNMVEDLDEVGKRGRKLLTEGRYWIRDSTQDLLMWSRVWHLRLQPQAKGDGYTFWEDQLCLLTLESSYFSPRHPARNILASFRTTCFVDDEGCRTLLLDEVCSDWVDELDSIARQETLPAREVVRGKPLGPAALPPIPPCPVAGVWLEIALGRFVDMAFELDCQRVAWVPGRIQHELNPELPLSLAVNRYDHDVPRVLAKRLGEIPQPVEVQYKTYKRSVLIRRTEDSGWILVAADGHTPISEPIDGENECETLFRSRAEPVIETLPGIEIYESYLRSSLDSDEEVDLDLWEDPSDSPSIRFPDTEGEADLGEFPNHVDHWAMLYDMDDLSSMLNRSLDNSRLVGKYLCPDLVNGSEQTEEVTCLRWGDGHIVHDILTLVARSDGRSFVLSTYPLLTTGIRHRLVLERFKSWAHGLEACAFGEVIPAGASICFYDTRYFAGSYGYQAGEMLEVSLAGLAYLLRPRRSPIVEISKGPLWELERQRRLDEGALASDAAKPVSIHMKGGAALLRLESPNSPDDAQFQGVVEVVDAFDHDGQMIYRVEMVVMRPDNHEFRLPIFASALVLEGYVPRIGDDVEGVMWLQGEILGRSSQV